MISNARREPWCGGGRRGWLLCDDPRLSYDCYEEREKRKAKVVKETQKKVKLSYKLLPVLKTKQAKLTENKTKQKRKNGKKNRRK